MTRKTTITAALLLCLTGTAMAQEEAPEVDYNRLEVGILGGYRVFDNEHGLGRAKTDPGGLSPRDNLTFGGRLTFTLCRYFGLEAEYAFVRTTNRDKRTDMWIHSYRAQGIWNILPSARVVPFLVAGWSGISSEPEDRGIVAHDTDHMLYAGAGVKLPLTPYFGLRLDGRVYVPPAAFAPVIEVGDELGYHGPDFEGLLSAYVGFVPKHKPRKEAPPPPPPAPVEDLDPDRDGIKGNADHCPNEPEDKDGFEDDDGCPELDNDKDGIPDATDKCPNDPENKNGIDDEDGCPDEDPDHDGILGSADKCPNEPETKNNYQDDDGCPDEIPAAVKKFTGVIEGINFKTGSAEILKGSFALLDRAIAVLKEYKDVKLEITGHTDDRGSNEYNQGLSQKRADSVKNYFVGKGVEDARLRSVGAGEEKPIGDNKTESGRAKNRRTEFQLIQ